MRFHPVDSGEIFFEGWPVHIHGPKDAAALGIEIVYQDLALCDNLNVVQNMYLGRELHDVILDEPTAALGVVQSNALLQIRSKVIRFPFSACSHTGVAYLHVAAAS